MFACTLYMCVRLSDIMFVYTVYCTYCYNCCEIFSVGYIGYAPVLYDMLTDGKVKDEDDDQLYFTNIYLDEKKRVCKTEQMETIESKLALAASVYNDKYAVFIGVTASAQD